MTEAIAKPTKQARVVFNLRTTEDVRREIARQAEIQQRSMNWVLDRAVRAGLGMGKAA